ncbi:ATP-binding cassette domain-containing protein [Paenibacillus agaridevorans]|uniref:ATP-binding cassette domain-containing protein n=1 Tax=Paenibacillus agaridevorans TaxID=171404 RepID=UPI001BE3E9DA|nr:ATP-binding cassette domain-containing protein [Paenibacillus agaridevorans]
MRLKEWLKLLMEGCWRLLAGIALLVAILPIIGWLKFDQTKYFFDQLTVNNGKLLLVHLALLLMLLQIGEIAINRCKTYIQEIYSMRIAYKLNDYLAQLYARMHTVTNIESPMCKNDFYILKNHMAQSGQFMKRTLDLLHQCVMIAVYFYLISKYSWLAAFVALAFSLPSLLYSTNEVKRNLMHQTSTSQLGMDTASHFSALLNPYYQKELILHSFREKLRLKWGQLFIALQESKRKVLTKTTIYGVGIDTIGPVGYLVLQLLLIYQISRNSLTIGEFVAIGTAFLSLSGSLKTACLLGGSFREITVLNQMLLAFLRNYVLQNQKDALIELQEPISAIEIRNLAFQYPTSNNSILKGIYLKIEMGQFIVIVGNNGSGKSTLAKIVAGLHDVESDQVFINNRDINAYNRNSLYQEISSINQDFAKYPLSMKENITMNVDTDEATLNRFFDTYRSLIPKKIEAFLDTRLGSDFFNSIELSGGQWQRIAVARALFKGSSLLIMDEPTSEIDPATEMKLMEKIKAAYADKIVLLVTHNLQLAQLADLVYVMHDGEIVECGDHYTLLSNEGKYRSMWDMYSGQTNRTMQEMSV